MKKPPQGALKVPRDLAAGLRRLDKAGKDSELYFAGVFFRIGFEQGGLMGAEEALRGWLNKCGVL